MKRIALTQGRFAIVDDQDYDRISRHKWQYARVGPGRRYGRAMRYPSIYMHVEVLGKRPGLYVDHANHDGLDNRRSNLRFATPTENKRNGKSYRGSSSKYVGVSFHKKQRKWTAYIRVDGVLVWLGSFDGEVEAAQARDVAAEKYFGDFARLNLGAS